MDGLNVTVRIRRLNMPCEAIGARHSRKFYENAPGTRKLFEQRQRSIIYVEVWSGSLPREQKDYNLAHISLCWVWYLGCPGNLAVVIPSIINSQGVFQHTLEPSI